MTAPVEATLQEYLTMFQGPLPQDVIKALTAAFNLAEAHAEVLDEASTLVVGDAIDDVQEAVNAMQAELQVAT